MPETEPANKDLSYKEYKVTFCLDQTLLLPRDIFKRKFKDKWIFLAPEYTSWVIAQSEPSAALVENLLDHKTIRQSLEETVSRHGISMEKGYEILRDILIEIDYKSFYRHLPPEDIDFLEHPLLLHWYITDYCNFNCRHCYRNAAYKKPRGELTTSQCKQILDQFIGMGGETVTYSGGEALSKKDIFAIMSYGKSKGLKTNLLSNGALVNSREIVKRISDSAHRIQISIDGTCSEANDPVRGKGSFKLIMRALQNLKEHAYPELEVSLGVTVTRNNYKNLQENLVSFIKELDFPRLDVILGKALKHGRAEACVEDMVEKYEVISPVMADIISSLEELGWWNPGRYKRMHKRLHNCSWGVTPTMDSYGNALMCPFGERPEGNALEEPLTDILARMRKQYAETLVDKIPLCSRCEIKYICGGGCKIRNIKFQNDVFACDCDKDFKDYFYYQMARNQLS